MHLLEYTLCNLSELCKKDNGEISDLLLKLASATHYEYGPSDDIVEKEGQIKDISVVIEVKLKNKGIKF
jgi:hypothetical protein